MIRPGPRNLITDVDGILVGSAEDRKVQSGSTVVLCERPATGGVDVRGGAPGTRDTDLLDPVNWVDAVDAVMLSGGSAFGLDAAAGAMNRLAAMGRGVAVGPARVPIVPSAIIFDLASPGDKNWGAAPPYRHLGEASVRSAGKDFKLGNVGAGLGARAGRIKGGLGSVSIVDDAMGWQVGAIVVANPVGGVLVPDTTTLWAWPFEIDGEMGHQRPPSTAIALDRQDLPVEGRIGGHTTVGVVATNVLLDKASCQRLAIMAQDGLARAIRPAHTPFDGDTVFALATGSREISDNRPLALARLGALAADCMARAIGRAVYCAESLDEVPSYRSLLGDIK